MTSGKMGRNIDREVTVLKTAVWPAATERPSLPPSASKTSMPLRISSIREKPTLQLPAVIVARYGTKGPNVVSAGTALISLPTPIVTDNADVTASTYDCSIG